MLTSSLKKHISQLVIETYWTYMAIVLAAKKKKWDEALDHARAADAMYPKRDKQVAQFSASDGGGPSNIYMVDHRLAAILKVCFEPKKAALKDFDSIHLWAPSKSRRA
jgi:hypothetical protein